LIPLEVPSVPGTAMIRDRVIPVPISAFVKDKPDGEKNKKTRINESVVADFPVDKRILDGKRGRS
jgi:hypothetical protein